MIKLINFLLFKCENSQVSLLLQRKNKYLGFEQDLDVLLTFQGHYSPFYFIDQNIYIIQENPHQLNRNSRITQRFPPTRFMCTDCIILRWVSCSNNSSKNWHSNCKLETAYNFMNIRTVFINWLLLFPFLHRLIKSDIFC